MNRNFWLLTGGQAVSILGSSFGRIAMAWFVYELTGSKLAMGTMFLLTAIPESVLRLLGGPLVDRFNRIRLLGTLDTLSAFLYAVPPVLAATGSLELWHLYTFAVAAGLTRALHAPAYFALVPNVVPKEQLVRANSLSQSITTGLNMLGPVVAGLLVATAGAIPALIIDAFTFALSALAVTFIPTALGQIAQRPKTGAPYWTELSEGIRFFKQTPILLVIMLSVAGSNFASTAMNSMMVPFVRESLQLGASAVGLMTSAVTAGALLGGLLIGWLGEPKRRSLSMLLPPIVGGVAVISLSLLGQGHLIPAMILVGINGLQIGFFNPQSNAIYQRLVPDELRGRIMSVRLTLAWGMIPIASFLGSFVAEKAGLSMMYLVFGLVPITISLYMLKSRRLEALESPAAPAPSVASAA